MAFKKAKKEIDTPSCSCKYNADNKIQYDEMK